jgi:predicted ArsR family transcriptional regulator
MGRQSHHAIGDDKELTYRALADPKRRHLLRLLDDAEGPLEVGALAAQVGLHPNTIRDHLDLLIRAGLVDRTTEKRDTPGRPRALYAPSPRDDRSPGAEGYKFLAEVLAGFIETTIPDPAAGVERAGQEWGRYLVDRPAPNVQLEPSQVVEQIVTTLAELGFEPKVSTNDDQVVVELHDCPFREIARNHGQVVCSMHRGILRGAAEELGGAVRVDALHPLVEPSLCLVDLSAQC